MTLGGVGGKLGAHAHFLTLTHTYLIMNLCNSHLTLPRAWPCASGSWNAWRISCA